MKNDICHLFGIIRKALLADLCENGIPAPIAGSCLNWFDPALQREYLIHVDLWQRLLCKGFIDLKEEGIDVCRVPPFLRYVTRQARPSLAILNNDSYTVAQFHQVAMILYKFHGEPLSKTDWSEVALRLSSPPNVSLSDSEVDLLRSALSALRPFSLDTLGRFGPGVTAERFSQFERWNLENCCFPDVPDSFIRVNPKEVRTFNHFSASDMRITRMAEVPKTIKSNRLVSSEPAGSMYCQLAIKHHLDMEIARCFPHQASLHNQEKHNRLLDNPDYLTVDLSDASDYVSTDLVSSILPQLWPVLATVRSTHTLLPDGSLVPLRCFAPMGSGSTFHILTLVALAVCNVSCDHRFSVYGDDIICHRRDIDSVILMLQKCGLKVNTKKTCTGPYYRESCGKEMFGSLDISPAKIRDPLDTAEASQLEEIIARLERLKFSNTIESVIAASPYKAPRMRWNQNLQRQELSVLTCITKYRWKAIDGWNGLRRWFCVGSCPGKITSGTNLLQQTEEQLTVDKTRTKLSWRYKPAELYPNLVGVLYSAKQSIRVANT